MTVVSTFFGIVIRMLYREHGIPRFHAEHQGQQTTFTFDGERLAGNMSSRTALRPGEGVEPCESRGTRSKLESGDLRNDPVAPCYRTIKCHAVNINCTTIS
jgi:hypothetical protein